MEFLFFLVLIILLVIALAKDAQMDGKHIGGHPNELNPFSSKTYTHKNVRTGNIWEAKPRKNWSCSVCGTIIYAGTIAYHTGDHRDGKRTYVCSKCVDKIQKNN